MPLGPFEGVDHAATKPPTVDASGALLALGLTAIIGAAPAAADTVRLDPVRSLRIWDFKNAAPWASKLNVATS